MREIPVGIARGMLARVTVLRDEQLTDAAQRDLDDLSRPVAGFAGVLHPNPEQNSPEEALRERFDLERAFLAARDEWDGGPERARSILAGVFARIGPPARGRTPYLTGDARIKLLNNLAVAYSFAGDERRAIRISEYILAESGAPIELDEVTEWARSDGNPHRNRTAIQLHALSFRRSKVGFLAALAGDNQTAVDCQTRARAEALVALELRPDDDGPGTVHARLLSRSNLARIDLELAVLDIDVARRDAGLGNARRTIAAVVADSYEISTVKPKSRLIRAADLGMAVTEQARIAGAGGNVEQASDLAWLARALLKPQLDLYQRDADEAPAKAIRYGEACRLSGDADRARTVWQRSRKHLSLRYGTDAPVVVAVDELLRSVTE